MISSIRRTIARTRAVCAIALAQLRHTPMQTALTVLAIAIAVLSVTLFAGAGLGVLEFGQAGFERADQDLWMTGGPMALSPEAGIENPIVDGHSLGESVQEHEDVRSAFPLAFYALSVDAPEGETTHVAAIGIPGGHGAPRLEAGSDLSDPTAYYADGSYDGPLTNEILLDSQTAAALDVDVDDTVVVSVGPGGDGEEVTVVGITDEYSTAFGTETAVVPLAELQRLAGTARSDRATLISVILEDDADQAAVQTELEDEYPEYDVRTDSEQLTEMLESQAVLIASAGAIVALGVLVGGALAINVLTLSVLQRLPALRALHALGTPRSLLVAVPVARGGLLVAGGGAIGLALTPVGARMANVLVEASVGVPGLVVVSPRVVATGLLVVIVLGLASAIAVGWVLTVHLGRSDRIE